MVRYPLEIEFTNYCSLKCISCISKNVKDKWFLWRQKYKRILVFIERNKNYIEYLNLGWLWDNCIHPDILEYLDELKLLKGMNISLLMPTKWVSISDKILLKIKELKDLGIKINIPIWIFSLKRDVLNFMVWMSDINTKETQLDYYKKFSDFIKKLKFYKIDFSLELLLTKFSQWEIGVFRKFCWKLWVEWVIHRLHNFWWRLKTFSFLYTDKEFFNAFHCSYEDSLEDKGDAYYNDVCWFFPYIDFKWDIYPWTFCMHYYLWNIENYVGNFPDLIRTCQKEIDLNNSFCSKCTHNLKNKY